MPPVETRSEYSMDRAEAAIYLGVSTRTLDRYVRAGKVSSKKIGYHVFLSQKDIEDLKRELGERVEDVSVVLDNPTSKKKSQIEGFITPENLENEVYRVLYERSEQVIEKKQKEIDGLHFRLGQLEIELKGRVPLLEYQGNVEKLQDEKKDLLTRLAQEEEQRTSFERHLLVQRLLKTAYLGLFLLTVVAFLIMLALR